MTMKDSLPPTEPLQLTPSKKHLTISRLDARSKVFGVPTFFIVLKEEPQPHVAMTFGLSIVNPPTIRDSLRMLIYQGFLLFLEIMHCNHDC